MKVFVIKAAVLFMRILYSVLKLRPQKKRIVMLSRECDSPPVDFLLLENEIKRQLPDYEVVMLCKFLSSSSIDIFGTAKNTLQSMLLLSTASACILDTYSLPASVLNHRKGFAVIQIWHALGGLKESGYSALGKKGGHSPKVAEAICLHKNYSLVCAASESARELYSRAFGCDKGIIEKLGMPRIDYILSQSEMKSERTAEIIKNHPELANGKKNILYAPTFRADSSPDIEKMFSIIDTSKYNLAVKAHIVSGGGELPAGVITLNETIFDLFEISDYIITDYSAASVEGALTCKPLFFYVYDIDEFESERGLFIDPLKCYPSISSKRFEDIYSIIENGGYDYAALEAFKNRTVECADTHSSERIIARLREMLQ